MRSIRGALARPSSRSTTRLPFTSASVGTVSTRKRSASSGCSVDVDRGHAQPRALLAGEVGHQALHPPRGTGVGGAEKDQQRTCIFGHRQEVFPANRRFKPRPEAHVYTQPTMWEAYRIGVSLGLGIGVGGLLSALVAPRRGAGRRGRVGGGRGRGRGRLGDRRLARGAGRRDRRRARRRDRRDPRRRHPQPRRHARRDGGTRRRRLARARCARAHPGGRLPRGARAPGRRGARPAAARPSATPACAASRATSARS